MSGFVMKDVMEDVVFVKIGRLPIRGIRVIFLERVSCCKPSSDVFTEQSAPFLFS